MLTRQHAESRRWSPISSRFVACKAMGWGRGQPGRWGAQPRYKRDRAGLPAAVRTCWSAPGPVAGRWEGCKRRWAPRAQQHGQTCTWAAGAAHGARAPSRVLLQGWRSLRRAAAAPSACSCTPVWPARWRGCRLCRRRGRVSGGGQPCAHAAPGASWGALAEGWGGRCTFARPRGALQAPRGLGIFRPLVVICCCACCTAHAALHMLLDQTAGMLCAAPRQPGGQAVRLGLPGVVLHIGFRPG